MTATLTVLYPITEETTFDYDYYATKHFAIVAQHMGPFIESQSATKGLAGGPDVPPGFHAIFNASFASMDKLQEALGGAGPVLADIPNYYNAQPQMLIGEALL